jgi:hypothetical protein
MTYYRTKMSAFKMRNSRLLIIHSETALLAHLIRCTKSRSSAHIIGTQVLKNNLTKSKFATHHSKML